MIGRIYKVVLNGKVVKIGSTVKTLIERSRKDPYTTSKYKDCLLVLLREFEHEDSDFGLILLRVREQFDISKTHLWRDENGWNVDEPVARILDGFGAIDTCSLGGKIQGRKNVETGHWDKIRKLGHQADRTESGRKLGNMVKAKGIGIFAPGMAAKGGAMGAGGKETKRKQAGIFAPDFDKGKGGRANRGILKGWNSAHVRWHIARNIINPRCRFCKKISDAERVA